MKKHFILTMVICSALFLTSCGGNKEKEEEAKNEEPQSAVEAIQQLADKAKNMQTGEKVDPIDFRKLKELLPEEIAGLKRTEISGEKNGAAGFTISTADARYKGDGDASARIEIFDTGGIAGVGTMALAAWTMADIDKETETGYEKTTKLEGYKAFEKYNTESKSGELNVLVADRYVVNVNGDNITIDQLKAILGDLDLEKLAALK